jgi:hypothetical protein
MQLGSVQLLVLAAAADVTLCLLASALRMDIAYAVRQRTNANFGHFLRSLHAGMLVAVYIRGRLLMAFSKGKELLPGSESLKASSRERAVLVYFSDV